MIIEQVNFTKNSERWHLVAQFCKLRKSTFSDKLQWGLDITEGYEYDQYDGAHATYILAHEDGQVKAGCRLLPTNRNNPISNDFLYTYMLRDAHRGLLQSIPQDLLSAEPPTDEYSWELTRLVSDEIEIAEKILAESVSFLRSTGAKNCLYLGTPAFLRYARRLGYETHTIGPKVQNETGKFQAMAINL